MRADQTLTNAQPMRLLVTEKCVLLYLGGAAIVVQLSATAEEQAVFAALSNAIDTWWQ